jgi:hypothetical protein
LIITYFPSNTYILQVHLIRQGALLLISRFREARIPFLSQSADSTNQAQAIPCEFWTSSFAADAASFAKLKFGAKLPIFHMNKLTEQKP